MLQAESLAAYQADGLSVNASSIGYFFEALKAGFQFYILGAYGRESLVYSLGDIGKIILGEGGAITFTNRTASVHLDVAEVYLSGGGGITVPYIFGGIENSGQALRHYFIGNGTPVTLGNKTISALVLSDGFQRRHQRIMSGKTTSLKGSFSVNLKESVFHVGKTNVDYSISCANGNCTVTYDMFVRDGFWDPDFIDEYFMGRLFGEPLFQPDGPGPNLERFGGTPYPYNPVRGTYTFPNPGY
jgi:hypothetical protein